MTGFRHRTRPSLALLLTLLLLATAAASLKAQTSILGQPRAMPLHHGAPDTTVTLEVHAIQPGIYAAKVSFVWTGWVEMPDGILVVDTGFNEECARALADSIRARSGPKPIRYVVNTHQHGDHTGGDRYFGALGATFVVHAKYAGEIQRLLAWAPGETGDTLSHLGIVPKIKSLRRWMDLGPAKSPIRVMSLGRPAHSGGDLVVYLPKQRVLFAGDIVSHRAVPWLLDPDMNVNGWLHSLDSLLTPAFKIETLVPGHGVLATPREEIQFTNHYLLDARQKAAKVAGYGTSLNGIRDWGYLGAYEGLEFYDEIHFMNMRRLYNEAKGIKTPGRSSVRAFKRS